jgi:hypothetical protein
MMSISKEQWLAIEEELKGSYCQVDFKIDGHEVELRKRFVAENKIAIIAYVDGKVSGSDCLEDGDDFRPIVKKVHRARVKHHYSPAKKKKLEKDFGKRRVRKMIPNIDKTWTYYDASFPKASVLIRQYKKLEGLELTKLGSETFGEPENKGEAA